MLILRKTLKRLHSNRQLLILFIANGAFCIYTQGPAQHTSALRADNYRDLHVIIFVSKNYARDPNTRYRMLQKEIDVSRKGSKL